MTRILAIANPFAGVVVPNSGGKLNPNFTNPGDIISQVLPFVFSIAGLGLLVYLVLGGLQMMTSRGDPKALQVAQAKITTALIGFVIIFLSYSLTILLGQIFGTGGFGGIFK